MNGTTQPKNHTPLITTYVMVLGSLSIICGTWLISKGYMSGELLLSSGGVAAISGLLGMAVNRPSQPQQDITFTGGPPAKMELAAPKTEPQPGTLANNLV